MAEATYQVTIRGPQMAQTIVLTVGSLSIGRQAGNDLVLVHPLVSRRHASIECTEDACALAMPMGSEPEVAWAPEPTNAWDAEPA